MCIGCVVGFDHKHYLGKEIFEQLIIKMLSLMRVINDDSVNLILVAI